MFSNFCKCTVLYPLKSLIYKYSDPLLWHSKLWPGQKWQCYPEDRTVSVLLFIMNRNVVTILYEIPHPPWLGSYRQPTLVYCLTSKVQQISAVNSDLLFRMQRRAKLSHRASRVCQRESKCFITCMPASIYAFVPV